MVIKCVMQDICIRGGGATLDRSVDVHLTPRGCNPIDEAEPEIPVHTYGIADGFHVRGSPAGPVCPNDGTLTMHDNAR